MNYESKRKRIRRNDAMDEKEEDEH